MKRGRIRAGIIRDVQLELSGRNNRDNLGLYKLSFSVKGRSSTMFIKQEDVAEARRRIKRYKQFKELSFELNR